MARCFGLILITLTLTLLGGCTFSVVRGLVVSTDSVSDTEDVVVVLESYAVANGFDCDVALGVPTQALDPGPPSSLRCSAKGPNFLLLERRGKETLIRLSQLYDGGRRTRTALVDVADDFEQAFIAHFGDRVQVIERRP